jgi:plastocyanin
MKKTVLLTALIILAVALTGCSGQSEAVREEEKQLREVVLTDYKIEPEVIKISAHKPVRFIVKNEGNFTHDFTVLTEPPEEVEVAPTSKDYLDITINQPGDYEVVCKRHEAYEMKGKLIVEEGNLSDTESGSEQVPEETVKEKPQTENQPQKLSRSRQSHSYNQKSSPQKRKVAQSLIS